MSNNERNLSQYIDSLNEEKKPKEHGLLDSTPEMEDLFEAVRQVRSLKEPVLPHDDFPKKLAQKCCCTIGAKGSCEESKKELVCQCCCCGSCCGNNIEFCYTLQ